MLEVRSCHMCDVDRVVCRCSTCGHVEDEHGTIAQVERWIRAHGWVTVPGERLSDPKRWCCPVCAKKENT